MRKITLFTLVGSLLLMASSANAQEAAKPKSLKERAGYAFGVMIGTQLKTSGMDLDAKQFAAAFEAVMTEAMREGALDTNWLPAATAYHSHFMTAAGKLLQEKIDRDDISPPQNPLYSYTTTRQITGRDDLIHVMALQLSHPVLWVDLIRKLRHNLAHTLVEIGPGTMLSRSIRWIDRHIAMLDTTSASRIQDVIQKLKF